MLGRERPQEGFGIEDLPRCCSAGEYDVSREDASCRLNDDRSSDGVDVASRCERAPLFISLTDLYFHQELLRGTSSLIRWHRSGRRWIVQISEWCKIHVRVYLWNTQVPGNDDRFG